MTSKQVLDLRGVISPLNLLKCKSCLSSMTADDVLEVLLTDTDVLDDLILIVKRSRDDVLYQKKKAGYICLGIQKGNDSTIGKT
ncbi:MAG: sulfurtransferase TusA family protein [Pseudomonadota bacterium]